MIQIFIADGWDGRDEPTEGSTRGPRGPKKKKLKNFGDARLTNLMYMFLHPLKPTEDLEFRILYCLSESKIDLIIFILT